MNLNANVANEAGDWDAWLPDAIPNQIDLNVAQQMEPEVLLDLNVPTSMDIDSSNVQFNVEVDQVSDAELESMVVLALPAQPDEPVNFLHLEIQPNELNAYLSFDDVGDLVDVVGDSIQDAHTNAVDVTLVQISSEVTVTTQVVDAQAGESPQESEDQSLQ
jgi:hypothetical protein